MSTLAESLVASTVRPIVLRKRADLVSAEQQYHDGRYWVVKEPLGLNYYRQADEEYALLQMLDGRTSLEQLQQQFELQFAPQRIDFDGLSMLIADFYQKGLVYSHTEGQGHELAAQNRRTQWQTWKQRLANPLVIRLRGIYPGNILKRLDPYVRWCFRPWAIAFCLLLMISALGLAVLRYDEFYARMPSFEQFFTVQTGLWLMGTLAVVKVLHELGHGMACRHFGGECPEIGIMFLVFTPCLYCNVSDSWMLSSKWRRMAVSAAGVYVELVLAAAATFLWWYTAPGLLHHVAMNVMCVCSVSTLLFNANPLMRYDGYYVLCDLLEIPNLSQQANAVLSRTVRHQLLGMELEEDAFLPRKHLRWFMLYAIAAPIYRVVLTISILWFVHAMLKPYRLQALTQLFVGASLVSLIGYPLYRGLRFLRGALQDERLQSKHFNPVLAVSAALVLAFVVCPFPHRVYGTFSLEPAAPSKVYVEVPGELAELRVRPGQQVPAGTVIAQLHNPELDLQIETLVAECSRCRDELENLYHRRFQDASALAQIPEKKEQLSACETQLAQRQRDRARLTLTAARAGAVLPVPEQSKTPSTSGGLPSWYGSLFEPRNRNCFLPQGTTLCCVGEADFYEAAIVVEQSDLAFLRLGQVASIQLAELPFETFSGIVEEISRSDLNVAPRQLSNKSGGELATRTDESGQERPQEISYLVRVSFRARQDLLRTGLRGEGKIYTPWMSLGSRAMHWFSQTFHFRV